MSWLDENQQRDHWELAVRELRDGLWCWEVETNQFWCSPQFWRLLGYQDAEFDASKPTRFDEHIHPDDMSLAEDLLRHHSNESQAYDVNLRLLQKNGPYSKFRLCGSVERNKQGKPIRAAGTMQIVSDSSALQQQGITQQTEDGRAKGKRTSNEQYHLTPVMMHSTDTDGRLIDVSDFWCQHLGYQPDEVIGSKISMFLTEKSRQRAIEEVLPEFYREGRVVDVPYQVRRKSGEVRDVLLSAESIRSQDGRIVRSLAVMVDVTDRVQSERDLFLTRSRLSLTLTGTKIGLWDWDTLTDEVYFSKQCKLLLGFDEDEPWYSFRHWEARVHPDDRADAFGNLAAYVDGSTPEYNTTYRLRAKDESYRWFLARGRFIEMPDASRDRIAGVLIDITEQKEAEQKLASMTQELQRSNRELQQFAYVASHDLQEPLRAVESFCRLLQERYSDALDEQGQAFITHAVNGAQRMKSMTQSLLEYSRVQSHARQFTACDMDGVLQIALSNLATQIRETNATVGAERTLPTVQGDAMQLARVFQNLINNAIKFRKADAPPKIAISCTEDQHAWEFALQDNGIGFDPVYGDEIFEIFRRLQSRTAYEGTGIGLSIAKRIVEVHRGSIWAESELGVGSCFKFTLPKQ